MNILFSCLVIIISWIFYKRKLSRNIFIDYIIGRRFYRKRKQSGRTQNLLSSTTISKEITVFILSLLFSVGVLLVCNCSLFQKLVWKCIESIVPFTHKYPLTVSVLGAFIALWGIYFTVHLKFFISPVVAYNYPANLKKKTFMWYICNRSIFDAVNINVSIFKCKKTQEGVLYEELKLTCPTVAYLTGRIFPKTNKVIVKIVPNKITIDEIVKHSFDFFEINVTAVHALSNVITVWTTQSSIEDVYHAKIGKDVIMSDRKGLEVVELDTLRVNMCNRFMRSRKIVSYSTLLLLIIVALNLGLEDINIPEWLNILNYGFLNGLACVVMLFSTMRYLMQLPVVSTLADYKYKSYRVETR